MTYAHNYPIIKIDEHMSITLGGLIWHLEMEQDLGVKVHYQVEVLDHVGSVADLDMGFVFAVVGVGVILGAGLEQGIALMVPFMILKV